MKYRTLGTSGLTISEIGLGCWTLGGLQWKEGVYSSGWTPVDEKESMDAIQYALDNGVTYFDTADVYGNGESERKLAQGLGLRSRDVIIGTKIGWMHPKGYPSYERYTIRQQCEQSLRNLKRDYIDIYYFHHANFGKDDCMLPDAVREMERLHQEGKIRFIGLCSFKEKDFLRLGPQINPAVFQSFAHCMDYHFIAPHSPVMRLCKQHSISFIAASPLNKGLLLGKYPPMHIPQFPYGDHRKTSAVFSQKNIERAWSILQNLSLFYGSLTQDYARVALQFILYHSGVGCVIPGFRNKEHVSMNIDAIEQPLRSEDIKRIYAVCQSTLQQR